MYLIIGQGAAGVAAAGELRRLDPAAPVTILTADPDNHYSRVDLPDIIAGKLSPADATLKSGDDFASLGITCREGQAAAVLPAEKAIVLADGQRLYYGKLLLATGSRPVVPALPGAAAAGVFTLWTMRDALAISAAAGAAKAAAVVGAGLIGIKTALALAHRGLEVTLIEQLPGVLPRQLDGEAGAILADRLREKGLAVITGVGVENIVTSGGRVAGVTLSGRTVACDLVVFAVGVRPDSRLAAAAGLDTGHGILVDPFLQTSHPGIFAAGDAAEITGLPGDHPVVSAIWPTAVGQGLAAARNMAGGRSAYTPLPAMNAVEIAGLPVVSVGEIESGPDGHSLVRRTGDTYRKIILSGHQVRGVICVGDIRLAGVLGGLVGRSLGPDAIRRLLSPAFSLAGHIAG